MLWSCLSSALHVTTCRKKLALESLWSFLSPQRCSGDHGSSFFGAEGGNIEYSTVMENNNTPVRLVRLFVQYVYPKIQYLPRISHRPLKRRAYGGSHPSCLKLPSVWIWVSLCEYVLPPNLPRLSTHPSCPSGSPVVVERFKGEEMEGVCIKKLENCFQYLDDGHPFHLSTD